MEIWAKATQKLASAPVYGDGESQEAMVAFSENIDFLLSIIEDNRNIPVMLVDENDNILQYRNFKLPEPIDSISPYKLTDVNKAFLAEKLQELKHSNNHIEINIDENTVQHLYYEDSTLLKRILFYPNIQLAVMVVFVLIVYFAVVTTKKG